MRVIHANSFSRIRLYSSSNFFPYKLDITIIIKVYTFSINPFFHVFFQKFFNSLFKLIFNKQTRCPNVTQHRTKIRARKLTTLILVDLASASSKIHQPLIAPPSSLPLAPPPDKIGISAAKLHYHLSHLLIKCQDITDHRAPPILPIETTKIDSHLPNRENHLRLASNFIIIRF